MKINFNRIYSFAFLISILIFQGCSKDKVEANVVLGPYQSGILVANEGGFGSSNGDVTFYNSSKNTLDQNIFKTVNGNFAGNVLESITLDGDSTAYLVLNGDNKIEIVNSNTLKLRTTFTDPKLINPRYLQVINGMAYISAWGAYDANFNTPNSAVVVVNLKTLSVVTTIPTDPGVENILYNGQYLFASNYNFGGSNTISVIDPTTNKSVKTIKVHAGPSGMVLDINHKLWVITTGNDAELIRINPSTLVVEDSIAIAPNANGDLGISADRTTLIYTVGASSPAVYKLGFDALAASTTPWFTASTVVGYYALGVDPVTSEIYLADALDYASAGKVYVYSADGILKTNFDAGIAPGQFIFR